MIIPIRCFTCNLILASKYKLYQDIIQRYEEEKQKDAEERSTDFNYHIEGSENAFNILKLNRYCCRRHLLAHVDLIDII